MVASEGEMERMFRRRVTGWQRAKDEVGKFEISEKG